MRTWLRFERYGKLSGQKLSLGRTTLVVGGNDSGKTTLIDALAQCMGEPTRERYGGGAHVHLDGGTPEVSASERALYLAREGELQARGDPSDLEERLRTTISDLQPLARELATAPPDASETAIDSLRRRLAELEKEQQVYAARGEARRLAELEAVRLAAQLDQLDDAHARLTRRATRMRQRIAMERSRQALMASKRELEAELAILDEQGRDQAELATLKTPTEVALAEFDRLCGELDEHQGHIATVQARREDVRLRLDQVAEEIATAEADEPRARRDAARATELRARIERFARQPATRTRRVWRRTRLLFAGALLLTGLATATLLGSLTPRLALIVGVVLGCSTLVVARGTRLEIDGNAADRLAETCGAELGLPPADSSPTLAEVALACDERIRAYNRLRASLEEHLAYKTRVEEELAIILERNATMLQTTLFGRQAPVDAWLAAHGLTSRDALSALMARRQEIEMRLAERRRKTGVPDTLAGCDARVQELALELDDLSGRIGNDTDAASDDELAAYTESCADLERERDEIDRARTDLNEQYTKTLALALADDDVTSAIAEIQRERGHISRSIEELERRPASTATQLLIELAGETDLHRSIFADTLSQLLGATQLDLRMDVAGVDDSDLSLLRCGASPLPLVRESSSIRDLVSLALRLALITLLEGPDLPVVLEEPFARLDGTRIEGALRMLRLFQDTTNCQVVLISRDRTLLPVASDIFESLESIDLDELKQGDALAA